MATADKQLTFTTCGAAIENVAAMNRRDARALAEHAPEANDAYAAAMLSIAAAVEAMADDLDNYVAHAPTPVRETQVQFQTHAVAEQNEPETLGDALRQLQSHQDETVEQLSDWAGMTNHVELREALDSVSSQVHGVQKQTTQILASAHDA